MSRESWWPVRRAVWVTGEDLVTLDLVEPADGSGSYWLLSGSPTGEHRLAVGVTSLERLNAHWEGYQEAAMRALGGAA